MIISHREIVKSDWLPLRQEDEVAANAMGFSAYAALQLSAQNSVNSFMVEVDGKAIAAWGYGSHGFIGSTAYLWLLTTREVHERYPVRLARASRRAVAYVNRLYPKIEARVHRPFRQSLNWLLWLDFRVIGEEGDFLVLEKVR